MAARHIALRLSCICALVVVGAGCGSSDDDGEFVDDRPIELRGSCDPSERAGRFRLEVILEGTSAGSFLSGDIFDRVDPSEARELVASEGDCQLLRRPNPLCDPGCTADQVCSIDEVCVPSARGVDIGPIRVGGLVDDVEMEARPPGNDYFDTTIAHPAFAGAEEIRLRGQDGDLAIDGMGSEDLVVTGGDWSIVEGQPMAVTWEPPTTEPVRTRVALGLSIDQHGTTPVRLVCEFEDTGSAMIPASVIDELYAAGVSGFATASLERRTADSQMFGDFCVEFVTAHPRRHNASVAGHTPCNGPNDCPAGQTCDLGTNTCVDE